MTRRATASPSASRALAVLAALAAVLAILSLPVFASRVLDGFLHPERQNTTDMAIFAGAGKRFLHTGQLYERSDNYATAYAPGAGVYKFPPAYQLTVLPFLKIFPDEYNFLLAERVLYLALYLAGLALVVARIGRDCLWGEHSLFAPAHRTEALLFLCASALAAQWSMGFFECFSGIEPEIPVFFCIALWFHCFARHDWLAGIALGVGFVTKLYPAMLLAAFVFPLRPRGFAGFALGAATATALSLAVVGVDEHAFYLAKVLPVLLREAPVYHIQNKTLEAFFNAINLLPAMTGTITRVVKVATLLSLVALGLCARRDPGRHSGNFALLCSLLPLFCLSNFWQQYHILLALPLTGLLAHAILRRSLGLALLLLAVAAATSIQEAWYQDLIQHALATARGKQLIDFQIAHPAVPAALLFFPHLWLLARLRDFVFLAPLTLYLTLAFLLWWDTPQNDGAPA